VAINSVESNFYRVYDSGSGDRNIDEADIIVFGDVHSDTANRANYCDYINYRKPTAVLVECIAGGNRFNPWDSEMTAGIEKGIELRGWDDREVVALTEKECPHSYELVRHRAAFAYCFAEMKRGNKVDPLSDNWLERNVELLSLAEKEKAKSTQLFESAFLQRQRSLIDTTAATLCEKGGPVVIIGGYGHVKFTPNYFKNRVTAEDENGDTQLSWSDMHRVFEAATVITAVRQGMGSDVAAVIKNAPEPQWRAQFHETFKDKRVVVLVSAFLKPHIVALDEIADYSAARLSGHAKREHSSILLEEQRLSDSSSSDEPHSEIDGKAEVLPSNSCCRAPCVLF